MDELVVGAKLDQYRVTGVLARGGMASIFEARDDDSGGMVVLKVPHLQFESDVVFFERFRREESIGQRLDHPAIVKVYAPREKSRLYLAMERVEGRSLRAVLSEGPIERERALDLARQLCAALSYMHEQGVVHRDLKPENLIVTPDGRLKIIDFGLALARAARRITWTRLSITFGTPDYIAPEQLGGRRGDARSDVYAAGTILFELLTSKLPYDAHDARAILRAKKTEQPRRPSVFVPDLDPAIEAVVMRAIERAPADRYPSAAAMLEDLRHPGAVVREPPAPRRFVRPLVVAAILVGLGALIWIS